MIHTSYHICMYLWQSVNFLQDCKNEKAMFCVKSKFHEEENKFRIGWKVCEFQIDLVTQTCLFWAPVWSPCYLNLSDLLFWNPKSASTTNVFWTWCWSEVYGPSWGGFRIFVVGYSWYLEMLTLFGKYFPNSINSFWQNHLLLKMISTKITVDLPVTQTWCVQIKIFLD